MTPRLSILMPTYNGGRYCGQQVESILGQSFGDFELLVVDDGSTDDTRERLTETAAQDRRIRILADDKANRGQRFRLLELLAEARGQLIGIADQDDVWVPGKLKSLIEGLGEAGMAFGPSHIIDGSGQSTGLTLHGAAKLDIRPRDRLRSLAHPLVSAHAMIVRRELVRETAFCATVPFDWCMALDAQYTLGLRYIEDAVTLHRVHDMNQNNGDLLDAHTPLSWRARIALPRNLLPSGALDRFSFWKRAAYLANSPVVEPRVRRAFALVCRACEQAWFIKQGPYHRRRNETCQTALLDALEPFAGSPEDWSDYRHTVALLTANWRTRNSRYMSR
jgi:glycosyltransferase involved in cell wall biosynthesis